MAKPIQIKRKSSSEIREPRSGQGPDFQGSRPYQGRVSAPSASRSTGVIRSQDSDESDEDEGPSRARNLEVRKAPDIIAMPPVRFPAAWGWFFDESITGWVKTHYSPKDSWKDKPFSKEDSRFFFKGIDELSEMFTEERAKGITSYFNHPKFRSAYLLYFFPLQAAKFVTVFQLHAKAFEAALAHGRREGELRIVDLGAGPGTASVAALLQLLQIATATGEELPPIRLLWVDSNFSVMQDGKKLAEDFINHFSKLRGKVEIEIRDAPWWKAASLIAKPASLILLGHVINESAGPDRPVRTQKRHAGRHDSMAGHGANYGAYQGSQSDSHPDTDFLEGNNSDYAGSDSTADADSEIPEDFGGDKFDLPGFNEDDDQDFDFPETESAWGANWKKLFERAAGGGVLIVEPASKRNSQFLSQLRDAFIEHGLIAAEPGSIWGPCLHAERCPLAEGRDWCHFSVPAKVPGNWFLEFSKSLGSERQWLKFSYLWVASQLKGEKRAPVQDTSLRRVVSDPLSDRGTQSRDSRERYMDRHDRTSEGQPSSVLLCEPELPGRLPVPRITDLKRGDLVKLK